MTLDLNYATITPLAEFVRRHANQKDHHDLTTEILLAKGTLQITVSRIDQAIIALNKPGDEKLQTALRNQVILLGDKLRQAIIDVSRIVKMSMEIESLKASRVDALQLISILQQIPDIVRSVHEATLCLVLDRIHDDIIAHFGICDAHQFFENCTYFNSSRAQALLENANLLTVQLSEQLNTLKVVHNSPAQPTEDDVRAMIESVPMVNDGSNPNFEASNA